MINSNTKSYTKASLLSLLTAFVLLTCSVQSHASIPTDSELISVIFWSDSTDMQASGSRALRDAIQQFKSDPNLSFTIEGKSNFRIEKDGIGLRRAETLKSYLIKEGISSSKIKILSSDGRKCLLLLGSNNSRRSNSCSKPKTCMTTISIDFWSDSTDMQLSGKRALSDAAREFRSNRSLSFQLEGKSSFSIEKDDLGIRRAETIKAYLIKEGISSSKIKILSSKGRKCLLLLSS